MSWYVVATKDFKDAARSKVLWFVTGLFVLLVGGLSYAFSTVEGLGGPDAPATFGFIIFLQGIVGLFIPIAALLVAYKSIAGERESGTISYLLGLPIGRRSVVLGKLVGRTAVLALALALGFAVAAAVLYYFENSLEWAEFALFALLSILYGAAFVSAAVGLSSITASSSRAAAAAFGFWIFDQFWGAFALAILYVANGFALPEPPFPNWYLALTGLSPSAAFSNAAAFFLPAELAQQIQTQVGSLPEWYGLAVLGVWFVIPLVLGALRFERLDLG